MTDPFGRERRSDHATARRHRATGEMLWRWWLVGVTVMFVAVAAQSWQLARSKASVEELDRALARIERESVERVDETCRLFETDHLADVVNLRSTYDYLTSLSPRERRETINVFIVRALPQSEREARSDPAPDYCDKPGVGLPEPDPEIPRRPPGVG